MVITLTLNPALDIFCRPKRLRTGATVFAGLYAYAGGKGINVSRALKRLGQKTIAVGYLGGMTGERIRQFLYREGICCEFVKGKNETRVNITILPRGNRRAKRVLGKGHTLSSAEIRSVANILKRHCRLASQVVFSGSLPPGVRPSLYRELIKEIQKKNIPCLLDSHGAPFREGLKAKPVYIKPNLQEAEVFFKKKLNSQAKLEKAVRSFFNLGIKNVLISLGGKGAVGGDGQAVWLAVPPRVKSAHTVGCGDAFVAGFLTAVESKCSFAKALQMAVAAGTAAAQGKGPADIDKKIVRRIFRQVKVEHLPGR